MKIRPALALFVGGAAAIATLVFTDERLWFETHALLMRPAVQPVQTWHLMPDVVIRCDKPDCEAGFLFYEVIVDADGRPRATRFDGGSRNLEPSARAKAAQAALAARWPTPRSGKPIRSFQHVSVLPHERMPTRHVPFPETNGQAVSITLERENQLGTGSEYVVTLSSDGVVDFCGQSYLKVPGQHRERISSTAFESLVREFRKADFFSLDDRYIGRADDGPAYYLRIQIGEQEKKVVDFFGGREGMPAVVTSLQDAVDEAAGTSRWIGSPLEWGSGGAKEDCPTPLNETIRQAPRS